MSQDPVGDAFKTGDLAGAIAAATVQVKAQPTDFGARWLMAELLLINGEAERADRMLDAVISDQPIPTVLDFRTVLRAEVIRQQVWQEGRAPKFQGDDATPAQQAALRAAVLARTGNPEEAEAAAAEAEELRPAIPGVAELDDGRTIEFNDFRDGDDIFGPTIEVLTTSATHILVPVERIASLEFEPPKRPRDLVWRRATITLKDSTEGVVYIPAIYSVTPDASADVKLGRETSWSEGPGPVRGIGQRVFLVGDADVAISELKALRFT